MARPAQYKNVEDLVLKYLTYNGLTVSRCVDGRYYRVTQKEFARELAEKLDNYPPVSQKVQERKLETAKSLRCRIGFHKFYYIKHGLMTSIIKCARCGLKRGVGHDIYGTTFEVDQD